MTLPRSSTSICPARSSRRLRQRPRDGLKSISKSPAALTDLTQQGECLSSGSVMLGTEARSWYALLAVDGTTAMLALCERHEGCERTAGARASLSLWARHPVTWSHWRVPCPGLAELRAPVPRVGSRQRVLSNGCFSVTAGLVG